MATFTGTSGDDDFIGADDQSDVFNFIIPNLSGTDTVTGGGGSGLDIFNIQSAGAVTAELLAGVSGIERFVLEVPSISLTLNDAVAGANSVAGVFTIHGSNGSDTVDGLGLSAPNGVRYVTGTGEDSFSGGAGSDVVSLAPIELTTADSLSGGAGLDTLEITTAGGIIAANFAGIASFERIVLLAPEISLYLSDAAVHANKPSGLMTILGSTGRDWIDGSTLTSASRLHVRGGEGGDDLYGGGGNDVLAGEGGNDRIYSGGGGRSYGGTGDDKLAGGGELHGQSGNDNLEGGAGGDDLYGGIGKDYLYGDGGADRIFGNAGRDVIDDSAGHDTVDGGAGIDTISVAFFNSVTALNYAFDPAALTPNGSTLISVEAVNVTGGNYNDTIAGGSFHDLVRGWQGNDILYGHAGNDFIIGDNGNDTLYGGRGDDTLTGNGGNDTLDGGDGDDWLIGGRPFDVFSGANLLIGGAGADTLDGGGGTTTLSFETSAEGVFVDFVRGRGFGGDAQGDVYLGVGGFVYLSNFDDVAIGGAELFGLGGDDTLVQTAGTRGLTGGAGSDSFELNFNFDVLFERLVIADFDNAAGDKIDLSDIDARPAAGDQAFTFIGTADFTATTGQVRYRIDGADTIVELQIRGDATPDYAFVLTGNHVLTAADFVL